MPDQEAQERNLLKNGGRADDGLSQINVSHNPSRTSSHLHVIRLLIKLMSLSMSASARLSVCEA